MKILFAVSNDNITTSVVNKYQQKYKEIITNKNVYYFNAIIKELQKNKSYDAIVIGEDLEPISNNNYEAIDKFLFEKLDSISDEAAKPTGEDIPIILICSDRRTQADGLLIKLFGIGIYNAIIGNDRSIDTVCNLINKPRNKKEAKLYYKVESDEISPYERTNDSDVSETEIQNILAHYRKIGNNPQKCAQSFDSISEQYNETQLRIIIKFLPKEVKAILETNSPKFQKLVNNGTVLSNGKYVSYNKQDNDKKEKMDILTKDLKKTTLSRPVIIPSTIDIGKKNASRVNPNPNINHGPMQNNANSNIPPRPMQNNQNNNMPPRPIQNNTNNNMTPMSMPSDLNNNVPRPIQNYTNNNMPPRPMPSNPINNMARPIQGNQNNNIAKPSINMNQNIENQGLNNMDQMKIDNNEIKPMENNLVRPSEDNAVRPIENDIMKPMEQMNVINSTQPVSEILPTTAPVEQPKRGRGRPRKNPDAVVPKAVVQYDEFGNPIKRGRGRPRKQPIETQAENNSIAIQDTNTSMALPKDNTDLLPYENKENQINNAMPSVKTTENNNMMPGFEPIANNNVMPGFEPIANNNVVPSFEPITNNPSFEQTKDDDIFRTSSVNSTMSGFGPNLNNDMVPGFEPIANNDTIPGFENDNSIFSNNDSIEQNDDSVLPGFGLDNDLENLFSLDLGNETVPTKEDNSSNIMPGFENDNIFSNDILTNQNESLINTNNQKPDINNIGSSVITGNGKLVAFVGTSKNGTSFIVNNLAQMLSSTNVKTAILDLTQNKNSYYMFTNNDQNLMQIAVNSMKKLSEGKVNGVNVNRNLSVFTSLPDEKIDVNINTIMQTLSNNFDVILIDCDFATEIDCFKNANEIYLIQTMDTFTIQPLTKFLSDLKLKNVLDESKLRVVINKYVRLKKLNEKMIIGGMSKYNEPSMTLQRDLFNSQTIKYTTIPFEIDTYARYLENIAMCELNLNGYSQNLMNALEQLKGMVYPLIYGGNKPNSNLKQVNTGEKRGLFGVKKQPAEQQEAQFTSNINDTLNKMRSNNF